MATTKGRKSASGPKPAAKAAKSSRKSKGPRGTEVPGLNYVVVDPDGNLVSVVSGQTGKILGVASLTSVQRTRIEDLIRQRQALGIELSEALQESGYEVAIMHPTVTVPKN